MQKLTEYQRNLVEGHMDLVDRVIHSRIGRTADPMVTHEDLLQAGAEALCRAALAYDPLRGSFAPFAQRVVHHALLDYCRHMRLRFSRQAAPLWEKDSGDCSLVLRSEESERALRRVENAGVWDCFRVRKEQFRGVARCGMEAMELKIMGFTTREIARMYGTNVNNVNAWISRARQKLRADEALLKSFR